ncbi:MAG: alpha-L-rhamnosidase N-terminal domain-containing protein [Pseudomonadota bacterium]
MTASPGRLRSDFLEDPLGLAPRPPILSWRSTDPRAAECQTGYQVLAASRPGRLKEALADRWDSGWVTASGVCTVRYGGAAPRPRERIWWTVRTRDSDGLPGPFARPAFFEVGLEDDVPWAAQWIGAPLTGSRYHAPAPAYLARDFGLSAMPLRARLYLAMAGSGRAFLNGTQLLSCEQMPLDSDYAHRVRYRVIDVTAALHRGRNRLALVLADHSYSGNQGNAGTREAFGPVPLLRAQLELHASDGSIARVLSDQRWHYRRAAVIQADPVLGECWDERARELFPSRPSEPLNHRDGWAPVREYPGPAGAMRPDLSPRLDERRLLRPVGDPVLVLDEWQNARWEYELPERALGQPEVSSELPSGEAVAISYQPPSALRDSVTLGSTRGPVGPALGLRLCDRVAVAASAAGLGAAGTPIEPGLLAASATPPAVVFRAVALPLQHGLTLGAEDAALNDQLQRWLTDLRTRAVRRPLAGYGCGEGLGPRAEAGIHAELPVTGALDDAIPLLGRLVDAVPLLRSFLEDLIDAEARTGIVPGAVPDRPRLAGSVGPGHFPVLAEIVWALLTACGDQQSGSTGYDCLRRVLLALAERAGPSALLRHHYPHSGAAAGDADELIGSAMLYHCAGLARQIAELLGRNADEPLWTALRERLQEAFLARFVTADGVLVNGSQTALTVALRSAVLPEAAAAHAVQTLARAIHQQGLRVAPGLAASALAQLSRCGFADVALAQLAEPSRRDALAERYGRTLAGAALLEWVLGDWLGIAVATGQGAEDLAGRRLRIAPLLARAAQIGSLSGRYETVRGAVAVRWACVEGGQVAVDVTLPVDVEAELILPGCAPTVLRAGSHRSMVPLAHLAADTVPSLAPAARSSA